MPCAQVPPFDCSEPRLRGHVAVAGPDCPRAGAGVELGMKLALGSHLVRARREFRVGDLHVNRAITGALVGRQPFGGFGLSGTGTQAGGPEYLLHFPGIPSAGTYFLGSFDHLTPDAGIVCGAD
jgi:hypothetical protein